LTPSETKKAALGARHFEGWQPGLLAVLIAVLGALVAVPHRTDPSELPLPLADSSALRAILASDRKLAAQIAPQLEREIANPTAGNPLFDLRAVGEKYRAFGRAEAEADTTIVLRARQDLIREVQRARPQGDDKLLALRAYQQQIFLAEVSRWETTRADSPELVEIAGPFVRTISRHGWSDERGRLAMSEPLRAIIFKRRWAETTGLSDPPFALSPDETRAFYAFLFSHPWVDREALPDPKAACVFADQWRLRKIDELAKHDPAYPRLFARGVVLFRLGDYVAAAQAFRDHLASASDSQYGLRARNYLMAANSLAEQPH
jgi:hypothetical protein